MYVLYLFSLERGERMTTQVADFIRSIEEGTADAGAQMALWHLIKRMNGRVVIDYGEPSTGWKLRTERHPVSRYVILVAEGEPSM